MISYANMKLKPVTSTHKFEWNGNEIEVLDYLPIEDKYDLIMITLQKAYEDGYYNPIKIDEFFHLHLIYMYTNINFTDKQKENFLELYDMIFSSGLWAEIKNILGNELNIITTTTDEVVHEVYSYKNSALGILQAIVEDYEELDLDADKLKEKIADKDNLKTLKNVMDKLG